MSVAPAPRSQQYLGDLLLYCVCGHVASGITSHRAPELAMAAPMDEVRGFLQAAAGEGSTAAARLGSIRVSRRGRSSTTATSTCTSGRWPNGATRSTSAWPPTCRTAAAMLCLNRPNRVKNLGALCSSSSPKLLGSNRAT